MTDWIIDFKYLKAYVTRVLAICVLQRTEDVFRDFSCFERCSCLATKEYGLCSQNHVPELLKRAELFHQIFTNFKADLLSSIFRASGNFIVYKRKCNF